MIPHWFQRYKFKTVYKSLYWIGIMSNSLRYKTIKTSDFLLLVSTYIVCERLSVMHEPAGVVEILVQILTEYPRFWSSEYPPKMKIVRESKSESFRIPPQMKIVRESKSKSFRIPPQKWKLSESPNPRVLEYPPNENCHRVQIWVSEYLPPIENFTFLSWVQISCSPEYPPPQLKTLVFFPKFKFHVPQNTPPPQNQTNFRFQTSE